MLKWWPGDYDSSFIHLTKYSLIHHFTLVRVFMWAMLLSCPGDRQNTVCNSYFIYLFIHLPIHQSIHPSIISLHWSGCLGQQWFCGFLVVDGLQSVIIHSFIHPFTCLSCYTGQVGCASNAPVLAYLLLYWPNSFIHHFRLDWSSVLMSVRGQYGFYYGCYC